MGADHVRHDEFLGERGFIHPSCRCERSVAIQYFDIKRTSGLPRRFALRNDELIRAFVEKRRFIQPVLAEPVKAFANMLIHKERISTSSMRTDLIGIALRVIQ